MIQESTTNPVNVDKEYSGSNTDNIGVTTKIPYLESQTRPHLIPLKFNIVTFCQDLSIIKYIDENLIIDMLRSFDIDLNNVVIKSLEFGKIEILFRSGYQIVISEKYIDATWEYGNLSLLRISALFK